MPLLERIAGIDKDLYGPDIGPHLLLALVAEIVRGNATANDAITRFSLDATEQAQVTSLVQQVQNSTLTRAEIHDVFLILNGKAAPYVDDEDVSAAYTRLNLT